MIGPLDYSQQKTPDGYHCYRCQTAAVKLWREYNTFSKIELLCVDCAGSDQKKDVSQTDDDGKRPSTLGSDRTDQIGWLAPAVPDEEGGSYWGYTSVPDAGVRWWRALPTRAIK